MLKSWTFIHILSKISAYRRDFDKTKCISFLIKDEKLLEKYNEIWKNISNISKKEFDSKPVCNEKYLITNINTNFHNSKIPKEGPQCISVSVILIDSVYRKDKDYYLQVFLEKSKYVVKEKDV